MHYVLLCYVLLYDLPPFLKVNFIASYSFVMYWYIMYCYVMYCYMIYHPSSRSISLLLILLWCICTLCIVTWSTTLHHGQLHQVKVIRNSEVLLPNFLWSYIHIISFEDGLEHYTEVRLDHFGSVGPKGCMLRLCLGIWFTGLCVMVPRNPAFYPIVACWHSRTMENSLLSWFGIPSK